MKDSKFRGFGTTEKTTSKKVKSKGASKKRFFDDNGKEIFYCPDCHIFHS